MPFPSKNDILIGMCFVFVGVIYALCERWLTAVKFEGTEVSHIFDHFFLMWALKQIIQFSLFFIWKAIDNNCLGCGHFKHGDIVQRANLLKGRVANKPECHDNHALNINDDVMPDGNGHFPDEPSSDNDIYPVPQPNESINRGDQASEHDPAEDYTEKKELVQVFDIDQLKKVQKKKKPSGLIYLPPAIFDQMHALLLYFGLKLTYSSSFIMLKGTITLFTALLSMTFLAQQLACYVWFGIVVATLGFAVSGISDYIYIPNGGYEKYGIAAGNLMIVMAQIMFAAKIIYEEKLIRKHSIHPMIFLGCEGFYGTIVTVTFVITFSFIHDLQYSSLPSGKLEDVVDAIYQFRSDWRVKVAVLGSLSSYILFTYLGLFLIRDHGALPRIMIETFVWSIYWAVCLALHWEKFFVSQIPGLCVIGIGTLIYSHILVLPFSSRIEGVDPNGGNLTEQFMNFNQPIQRMYKTDGDGNKNDDEVIDNNGERNQDREDDDLLDLVVVAEVYTGNSCDRQENMLRTADNDSLIQA